MSEKSQRYIYGEPGTGVATPAAASRKSLADVPCTCGAGNTLDRDAHKGACPRWQAIYYREKKGLPLE